MQSERMDIAMEQKLQKASEHFCALLKEQLARNERIKADKEFTAVHGKLDEILDAKKFIGRAPSQVVEFIENEVKPILTENSTVLGQKGDVKV